MPSKFCMVIGAPKSATTTLVSWLVARPDMAISRFGKEANHFSHLKLRRWEGPGTAKINNGLAVTLEDYLQGFEPEDPAADEATEWAVDGSTDYLWVEGTAERIKAFAETRPVKLIAVLRDPVDRAFSEWQHTLRADYETKSFRRSLELEPTRVAKNWHPLFYHAARSRYHAPLARYFELFGDDLLVLGQDEFARPEEVWARIQAHLGVSPFQPDFSRRMNESYAWRSQAVGRVMHDGRRLALLRRILPPEVKRRIYETMSRRMKRRHEMTAADEAAIFALIEDDVRACLADPRIPTAGWARSRRLAGG